MKHAQVTDFWKAARKSRRRVVRRVFIEWRNMPRLSDGSYSFVNPITLLCGENGAGKSSLLHLLYHALSKPAEGLVQRGNYSRPHGGEITNVMVELAGAEPGAPAIELSSPEDIHSYFCPAGTTPRVALIDGGMHIPAILEYIKSEVNFADYLEGVTPASFSQQDLEAVGAIVGRGYENISVLELEETTFGCVIPYFRVSAHGVSYESPDMGYGELAVLYLLWAVRRVENGSFVLMEEPEAFLSPRAQISLVDVLARFVGEKGLMLVLTSHSGPIATRLESTEIVYVARAGAAVVLRSPPRTSDLITRLGLIPDRSFVFFVEDLAGKIISQAIIDRYSSKLSGRGEYVVSAGDSKVLRALEFIPVDLKRIAHVGILDGDQRATAHQDPRIIYLPSDVAPETFLRNFCENSDPEAVASLLRVPSADYLVALSQADGSNHHDWPYLMAQALGIPYSDFVRCLALGWSERNRGEVEAFVREVEKFSLGT